MGKKIRTNLDFYCLRDFEEFERSLRVNTNLTNFCNNNCWYCNGNFQNVQKKYLLKRDQFSELIEFINFQDIRKVYMTLIGGEPTLNKDLPWMMNEANERIPKKNIYIVTNLLKSLDYFKSLPLKKRAFEFTCSFHSHAIKNYEEWFEKIDYLYEMECLSGISLMLTHKNIDIIKEVYDKYKNKYENLFVDKPIVHAFAINEFGYTDEYKKLCEDGIFEQYNVHDDCKGDWEIEDIDVILKDGTNDRENYQAYNNFYMMMCMCGLQVHANGNITRCLHDRAPIHRLGSGEKLKKFNRWHLCKHQICKCDLDFPKASAKYYMEHFKK